MPHIFRDLLAGPSGKQPASATYRAGNRGLFCASCASCGFFPFPLYADERTGRVHRAFCAHWFPPQMNSTAIRKLTTRLSFDSHG
jgi:hypothetical protein